MTAGPYGMPVSMHDVSGNGSAPRCEHVDLLMPVTAQSASCEECQARGAAWHGLLVCLTCGWVACSDDSPHRHALAHYEETDHPLAAELDPESDHRWCYVHRRVV
jgi:uncharacterized UBP type Zn finger protein